MRQEDKMNSLIERSWRSRSPRARRAMAIDHMALRVRQRQDDTWLRGKRSKSPRVRKAANHIAHALRERASRKKGSREAINQRFLRAVARGGFGVKEEDREEARMLLRSYGQR